MSEQTKELDDKVKDSNEFNKLDSIEAGEVDDSNLVLTTKDNPFNPKTQYRNWKAWDERAGHYTEAYVARVADVPIDVDITDDILIEQFTRQAQQTILDNDVLNIYLLV